MSDGDKPKTVNIELTPAAHAAVDQACKDHGMTKREMVARVMEWFVGRNKTLRALIVNQLDEKDQPRVARMVLRDMLVQDKGEKVMSRSAGASADAGKASQARTGTGKSR